MKNNRINLRQKILLFIFGIFTAVILLETALRLLGAAYSIHDTLKNKAVLTGNLNQRPVRILCLGACYTVGVGVFSEETYTSYLGQILRQNYPEKSFAIINKSVRGKSSSFFVNNLEKFIIKFKPQVIILEVNGITTLDAANLLRSNKQLYGFWDRAKIVLDNFLNRFKIYQITKMAFFLGNHAEAEAEFFDKLASAGEEDIYALEIKHLVDGVKKDPLDVEAIKKLAFAYAKRGFFEDAAETIKKAVETNKDNVKLYYKMLRFLVNSGQYLQAIELQKKFLISYPLQVEALCRTVNINAVARNMLPGSVDEVLLSKQYALIGQYKEARKIAEEIIERSKKKIAFKINYNDKKMVRKYKDLPCLLNFYRIAEKLTDNPAGGNVLTPHFSTDMDLEIYEMEKNPEDLFDFEEYDFNADEGKTAPAKTSAAEIANRLLRSDLVEAKRISAEHGVAILIENMGSFSGQQESIKNICREMRLPLADLYGYFYHAAERKSFFSPYPSYQRLNPKGNRKMAQQIYNALIDYEILSRPKN